MIISSTSQYAGGRSSSTTEGAIRGLGEGQNIVLRSESESSSWCGDGSKLVMSKMSISSLMALGSSRACSVETIFASLGGT